MGEIAALFAVIIIAFVIFTVARAVIAHGGWKVQEHADRQGDVRISLEKAGERSIPIRTVRSTSDEDDFYQRLIEGRARAKVQAKLMNRN